MRKAAILKEATAQNMHEMATKVESIYNAKMEEIAKKLKTGADAHQNAHSPDIQHICNACVHEMNSSYFNHLLQHLNSQYLHDMRKHGYDDETVLMPFKNAYADATGQMKQIIGSDDIAEDEKKMKQLLQQCAKAMEEKRKEVCRWQQLYGRLLCLLFILTYLIRPQVFGAWQCLDFENVLQAAVADDHMPAADPDTAPNRPRRRLSIIADDKYPGAPPRPMLPRSYTRDAPPQSPKSPQQLLTVTKVDAICAHFTAWLKTQQRTHLQALSHSANEAISPMEPILQTIVSHALGEINETRQVSMMTIGAGHSATINLELTATKGLAEICQVTLGKVRLVALEADRQMQIKMNAFLKSEAITTIHDFVLPQELKSSSEPADGQFAIESAIHDVSANDEGALYAAGKKAVAPRTAKILNEWQRQMYSALTFARDTYNKCNGCHNFAAFQVEARAIEAKIKDANDKMHKFGDVENNADETVDDVSMQDVDNEKRTQDQAQHEHTTPESAANAKRNHVVAVIQHRYENVVETVYDGIEDIEKIVKIFYYEFRHNGDSLDILP